MTFNFLIKNSAEWTVLFFILALIALVTQVGKESFAKSVPGVLRHLLKAAPALFLAGLTWYLQAPLLLTLALLLCASGDIFLDIPSEKAPWAFKIGAASFAAALVCLSIEYWGRATQAHPLMPLALTNLVIAIFILRWVVPQLTGANRILEPVYFGFLVVSNIIASETTVPIFLGSSLWLMSDLSIGLSENILAAKTEVNSLDTLGLYDLGLYFIALGFINS